jgi:hypothetical protein
VSEVRVSLGEHDLSKGDCVGERNDENGPIDEAPSSRSEIKIVIYHLITIITIISCVRNALETSLEFFFFPKQDEDGFGIAVSIGTKLKQF